MKKKLLTLLLVLGLMTACVAGTGLTAAAEEGEAEADLLITTTGLQTPCPKDETCPLERFADASNDGWYHDGIHYCVENGLMNGTSETKFTPNGTTTRAMVATILYRVAGEPAFMNDNVFSDVKAGSYYEKPVVWANGKSIVNGVGQDRFAPDKAVTREQLVTILYRYAQYMECDVSVNEDTNYLDYNDFPTVSEYALTAMMWALDKGILNGDNGNLKPAATATRAEVATIFQRFCQLTQETDDPAVVPPVTGGWTLNQDFTPAELPEDAQAAFDKAMEGFAGVGYTPVAYLGSQVVAGLNHAFLCTSTTVTAQPETGLAVVTVHADLSGGASVLNIEKVTLPEVIGEELNFPAGGTAGGWTYDNAVASPLSESVQTAFDSAMEGFVGVGYTPLACLGSQVVNGTNYAVLCTATLVTAEPATVLAVLVIHAAPNGDGELVSISGLNLTWVSQME